MALAHAPGCAAGSDEPPTGSVVSADSASHTSSTTGVTTSASSGPSTTTATTAAGTGGGGAGGSGSTSATTSNATSTATSGTGGCTPYGHTIAIDGVNDFGPDEAFATTSAGYTGWVAWDATNLTIGMTGADVGSGSATRWLVAYFSGAGGTTSGVTFNTQTPGLPFDAKWHVRWKADNSFSQLLTWNGTAWVDTNFDFTNGIFQSGNYVEIRIPRAQIGSPGTVDVAMSMVNEQSGGEFTFAGVPANTFTDGVDPNFAHYFMFDLDGCMTPVMHTPI